MKRERLESYKIIIAVDVMLTVTKVRIGDDNLYFEISSNEVTLGKLFPVHTNYPGVRWKTVDDIDPLFVKQIGEAIEITES